MRNTPTPGQVAYAAYCRVVYGAHAHPADYHTLTWGQHEAWEAAAQAVREAHASLCPICNAELEYCHAKENPHA